ncbi:MAG: DNA mismatch repair endonuclease MutL [Oscillospiraceae bacterium]|nr:DNA mismatch repair endonuclease MutL [Oscillospiraceae bacterium]
MARIIELDPHVADLIAAGEVVERPSSVVKELMENAIDAGAAAMTVEIKNGGMSYIRVTDDGCGIAGEDVKTAFLRHATSKLRSERDLEAIGTLGFRGEALAAIASVSRVELTTRQRGEGEGVSLALEAGAAGERSPAGCPEGTTIIVRDLFFNTPARLKFMKTDRAEGAGVSAAVVSCALGRPDVSVKYIKDGKEERHTPGDGRAESCVYTLFGREFAGGLMKCSSSGDGVETSGFVSTPGAARGNRGHQYFFVNGRCVKSKLLQAALEQAYRNSLFTGRFPACVLYITMGAHLVDVNVHPAKTEVKFLYEKQVFDSVHYAALSALERGEGGAAAVVAGRPRPEADFRPAPQERETAAPYAAARGTPSPPREDQKFFRTVKADEFRKTDAARGGARGAAPGGVAWRASVDEATGAYGRPGEQLGIPAADESGDAELPGMARRAGYRVIGEALNTYIVAEREDALWLIDKHAAHERVHFDRLKAESGVVMSQALLSPVIREYGAQDAALLLENAEMLARLGFEIESFGGNAVAARAIPSDIDVGDAATALEEICEQLRSGGGADTESRRDAALRTVACKAAVKSGRRHDMRELEALAGRVFSGEVRYCPHGRPVAMEISASALDRGFKRK